MKLIGILSWYDESPSWLAACVASLARAGCSHLVAVDGAYRLYPDGRPHSGGDQHEAITRTAYGAGIGCTLHYPDRVWRGNELEKRQFCFKLASQVAEPNVDWYFINDADQIVIKASNLVGRLENTDLNVGETKLLEFQDPHHSPKLAEVVQTLSVPREHPIRVRNLFRAVPGLSLIGNHYTYGVDGEVTKLWGSATGGDLLEEALDLCDFVHIEHRTHLRDLARKESQMAYYKIRDELGIERPSQLAAVS